MKPIQQGLSVRLWGVAPFAGACVETSTITTGLLPSVMSLPSRERVLKPKYRYLLYRLPYVAPFAGACVETWLLPSCFNARSVAPFAGACVETHPQSPSLCLTDVAPFAGACVETMQRLKIKLSLRRRSLRGSVC